MQLETMPSFHSPNDCITVGYFHACHSAAFWSHIFQSECVSYAHYNSLLGACPSFIIKQEPKVFLRKNKKDLGMACHTPPLKKVKK